MKKSRDYTETRQFSMKVLGRTLEHLGVQMYKRRDTAIAELVANAWDAEAKNVEVTVPRKEDYDPLSSTIIISDDGGGMAPDSVQSDYLVVGRNRRISSPDVVNGRPIMGRKGIGKLAGFGIAAEMEVLTWREKQSTLFQLRIDELKKEDDVVQNVPIVGYLGDVPEGRGPHGTSLTLRDLKHSTPLEIDKLRESLARRFSNKIRGEMVIKVNGLPIGDPALDLEQRYPLNGLQEETIDTEDGRECVVKYYYAFSKNVIQSPELRGFTVYVRGKTAQAPPFFFLVEGTASGQHGTRYVTGAIEADFLDSSSDDKGDFISTDRQEIDWEARELQDFKKWGEALSRRVLIQWADRKGVKLQEWLLQDLELRRRIDLLDSDSRKQIQKFLRSLSQVEGETENARSLADALVQAYEFQHFHNVISQVESISDDPEQLQLLLTHLRDWQVLESRAILEIVKGRLEIVDKFQKMIVNDAPETAHTAGADNMHDLLADYPWLLNPEWQVLSEEKSISKQLEEWGRADLKGDYDRLRYDFLALSDERILVVVEIKRPNHPVELDELHRLETYKDRLSMAQHGDVYMVMVCSGVLNVSDGVRDSWSKRADGEIATWNRLFDRARRHYEHYRSVLERNVSDPAFARKEKEVAQTREVLQTRGAYRTKEQRESGLGPQDVDNR